MATSNGSGVASTIAGLLVVVAALAPMAWAVRSTGPRDAAVTAPVAVPSGGVVEAVTETIIAPDPVEIDGLPESVVRALESGGNVREESPTELGLPVSVIGILRAHDVVLRVAEGTAP